MDNGLCHDAVDLWHAVSSYFFKLAAEKRNCIRQLYLGHTISYSSAFFINAAVIDIFQKRFVTVRQERFTESFLVRNTKTIIVSADSAHWFYERTYGRKSSSCFSAPAEMFLL